METSEDLEAQRPVRENLREFHRRQDSARDDLYSDEEDRIDSFGMDERAPQRQRRSHEVPLLPQNHRAPLRLSGTSEKTSKSGDASFQQDPEIENAGIRCYALAAAVVTWCIIQPFILFLVVAQYRTYPFRSYPGYLTILLLVSSIVVGIFVGPTLASKGMRKLDAGEPPSRIRPRLYVLVAMVTLSMALNLALLMLIMCRYG